VAGRSTLNRLELSRDRVTRYHKIGHAPAAIEGLFVTLFLEAYKTPLQEIILDLDATDDSLHGDQEGDSPHKPSSDNPRQMPPHTAYRAYKARMCEISGLVRGRIARWSEGHVLRN